MRPFAIQNQNPRLVHELRRLLVRLEGFPACDFSDFSAQSLTTQGFLAKSLGVQSSVLPFGLPGLDSRLPQGGLPFGMPHEIVPAADGDLPAAFGFVAALLGCMPAGRPLLLVTSARALGPFGRPHGHGLNRFGLDPSRLILVEAPDKWEALWALEEALRSGALAAVAGVLEGLTFKASLRLHLAARESRLPLLLLRPLQTLETSAAATRWRVGAAEATRDRFGLVARARWRLTLERCRNGRPGEWVLEYDHVAHRFSLAAALADSAVSCGASAS